MDRFWKKKIDYGYKKELIHLLKIFLISGVTNNAMYNWKKSFLLSVRSIESSKMLNFHIFTIKY